MRYMLVLPDDSDLSRTCRLATACMEALPALNAALPPEEAFVGVTFPPGVVVSDEPEEHCNEPSDPREGDIDPGTPASPSPTRTEQLTSTARQRVLGGAA